MAERKSQQKAKPVGKMDIWDSLCTTDPEYTEDFDKGTYKGTSISPVYIFKNLTEKFGPVGFGWKFEVLEKDHVFLQDGQVLALVDVDLFYKNGSEWSAPVRGSGGDFIVRQTKSGLRVDDDGRKKAITDALTNATRLLGQSADIHMGYFDDPDYKLDLAEKFENKDLDWKAVSIDLYNELAECTDEGQLIGFQEKNEDLIASMPGTFEDTTRQYIEQKAREIKEGSAQKWSYAFHGTTDAHEWFKKAASELISIKDLDALIKWKSDNQHIIGSLSILKAKKYEKDGVLPQKRLENKVGEMMKNYSQQPLAEAAE